MKYVLVTTKTTSSEKFLAEYRAREIEWNGKDPTYLNGDHRRVVLGSAPIDVLIRNSEPFTTIAIHSASQIDCSVADLRKSLEARARDSVYLRILNPNYILDPSDRHCMTILDLMKVTEAGKAKSQQTAISGALVLTAVPPEVVARMKKLKRDGATIAEICRDTSYTKNTVHKYTKGITAVKREVEKQGYLFEDDEFDYSAVERLDILGPRITRIIKEYLRSQRSKATKQIYLRSLNEYLRWHKRTTGKALSSVEQMTHHRGHEYLEFLVKRLGEGRRDEINRRFTNVRTFIGYSQKRGYLKLNGFYGIKLPSRHYEEVKTIPLTEGDIEAILDMAIRSWKSRTHPELKMIAHRNFVMHWLLAKHGLRAGGVINIRKKHFFKKGENWYLTVRNKTAGFYSIALPEDTIKVLNFYFGSYYEGKSEESFLMFTGNELLRQISSGGFSALIRRHFAAAGISDDKSSHSYRAAFAVINYKKGWKLEEIRVALGHRSKDQTARYIKGLLDDGKSSWSPANSQLQDMMEV